jgi:hypothetical protein
MNNSLRYNTSQFGSPVPILWGTQRVTVNVLDGFGFKSKGSGSGKGGVGGAGKGKSGGKTYSVNVQFGLCQGPISFQASNVVWSNAGIQNLGGVPLNFWSGNDGQTPDPVFASSSTNTPVIGYSGTATCTGVPLQLGNAPALPNISVEVTGFSTGSAGADQKIIQDCNPSVIIDDLLTNPRYGAGFPVHFDSTDLAQFANYCQANLFGMSLLMDKQQPAVRWVEEIGLLTVSALFWSSGRLRVVPYSTSYVDDNGATWAPNLTPIYDLTDDDYLSWSSGATRSVGEKDPVLIKRSDVSQLTNWLTVEILDRNNWYNPSVQPPVFDQASIELYGVRSSSSIQAHEVCNPTVGYNVASTMLHRKLYLRNTYQFRVGWRHMLLEPMDVVTLTDTVSGLAKQSVRIVEVQEDEGGALTMTAEDLV